MIERLTCPVCGYAYESGPEAACGPCPLHTDCAMACCPACGHTTINTQKSSLAQWVGRLFKTGEQAVQVPLERRLTVHVRSDDIGLSPQTLRNVADDETRTLDQVQPGDVIEVGRFGRGLSLQHQLRLQAFGVEPGQPLTVIQQHPVTIVKVDHTELAVERFLAHQIYVR